MNFSKHFYKILNAKKQESGWQSSFAKKAGISQSALSKIISGETKEPEMGTISAIVDALGDEFYSTLPSIRRLAPNAPVESVTGEGLRELAVYNVTGAGPAVELSETAPLFTLFAPPEYLRQASFALVVDGHSMEPLIPHRTTVGVNTDAPFAANEIYAARIPYEGLVIKRVAVDMAAREFVFKSENPNKDAYPDFRLNIAEAEKIIVGRVVWVMWGY